MSCYVVKVRLADIPHCFTPSQRSKKSDIDITTDTSRWRMLWVSRSRCASTVRSFMMSSKRTRVIRSASFIHHHVVQKLGADVYKEISLVLLT